MIAEQKNKINKNHGHTKTTWTIGQYNYKENTLAQNRETTRYQGQNAGRSESDKIGVRVIYCFSPVIHFHE